MNITAALIMGAAGMIIGWLVPRIALKTAEYKLKKSGRTLAPDIRYTSPALRLLCLFTLGALWTVAGLLLSSPLHSLLLALILLDAVVIIIVDLRIHIIPNEAVFVMLAAGLIVQLSFNGLTAAIYAVVTMVAVMAVFIALGAALGLHTIGAGDVKLAGAMGLLLGYPHIMTALIGMSALLLVWCLGGLALKKLKLKSVFAFAPFMMAGTIFAIVASLSGR